MPESRTLGLLGAATVVLFSGTPALADPFRFETVVNNADLIPGTQSFFNAYNPPSINASGLVVFRARGRGGPGIGQPATGIFTRALLDASLPRPILPIILRGGLVPAPNNTDATFTEFPSFPRIDLTSSPMVAFRGQSNPVWQTSDTRLGTSGVYSNPLTTLITGASQLGAVSGFDYFSVPDANGPTGLKFDQFPGAPSVTNGKVVFKGNWTDDQGTSRTGVYFRDLLAPPGEPVRLIADSTTLIPDDSQNRNFGSTAPPSAAMDKAVFLGVDVEAAPTVGGIYLSMLLGTPTKLRPLVGVGGLSDLTDPGGLTRIGEVLSFDGRSVAFWGAWGEDTFIQQVSCAASGNQARLQYCQQQSDPGAGAGGVGNGNFQFQVPVNQGIFVTDIDSKATSLIARTGDQFSSFLSWNFSGRPPGVGEGEDEEGDLELARWRSSAFMALDGQNLAFKGIELGEVPDLTEVVEEEMSGLYAARSNGTSEIDTIVETGTNGGLLDPQADGIPIVALGLERDGYRNGRIAFAASMALEGETEEDSLSWAGLYAASTQSVPAPLPVLGLGSAFGISRRLRRRIRKGS